MITLGSTDFMSDFPPGSKAFWTWLDVRVFCRWSLGGEGALRGRGVCVCESVCVCVFEFVCVCIYVSVMGTAGGL
jgi:hypothetical protein